MFSRAFQLSASHRFLSWLCLYVAIHCLVRLAMGNTLELDESEQVVLGQALALGYTTQPPLYTWLQWGLFQIFGHGVLALVVLKSGLIFSIYFFVWQIARHAIVSQRLALLAAFTLLLIPSVSWESLRDLTHSVLATALAAAAFYMAIRVYETGSAISYAWLGALLAGGMLAKYSFAVFTLSLLLAVISLSDWRRMLFDRRIWLTLTVGLVLFLPHLIWSVGHLDEIRAFVNEQVSNGAEATYYEGVLVGFGSLLKSVAEFILLLVLVVSVVFPQMYRRITQKDRSCRAVYLLLERFLLAAFLVCLGLIFVMGASEFQSRWFQPLLILLPVYLLARVDGQSISDRRQQVLAGVLLSFAVLVLVMRFGQLWLAPYISDRPNRMQVPSPQIAAQIRSAGFQAGTIITESNLTGGNLKLHFPESRVLTTRTEFFSAPPRNQPGQCLIAWDAAKTEAMPWYLREYLVQRGLAGELPEPVQISAPYAYTSSSIYRLAVILLTDEAACSFR